MKKTAIQEKQSPFSKLQKLYGLKDPEALKLRILWINVKLISLTLHGKSARNRRVIDHYDKQWKLIEQHEVSSPVTKLVR